MSRYTICPEASILRLSAALLLLGAILLGGSSALAQSDTDIYNHIEELHGDAAGFDRPLRQLVKAMRSGDAETVAGLAEYPLTVKANGESYDVESAEDFIDNFDDLVTPETRRAVGRQQFEDLFVNSDGVMLAGGAVWMGAICEDNACEASHWAIIAINN
ncbi:hypothetical protein [Rhizobium leguminosarum]|uniref:hypothetical protein n=1 Tax=Rhizobium leguminosarum TaxID=384 RepID=UPI001440E723|nr:hypothetical protein [Rhizobium leguminosarum]NKL06832.1 hypothetical protein [Rhizobium leguminosarum bv. viciae]NKL83247.1 hypothetical protein [Rhizobium leguminosarum bv. viciae]NKL92751.1 hypothetical protein [Rhizobium leguminosarum bv. viciae]NKM93094.1 hypothetical protein [Rhizobium leguminosarum bv. viciae]